MSKRNKGGKDSAPCTLAGWLAKHDLSFHELMDQVCALRFLSAPPGTFGTALLYPADAALRAKLASLDGDDLLKALLSLVIPYGAKTPAEFLKAAEAGHIGSRGGVLYRATAGRGDEVVLANGARIRPLADFKQKAAPEGETASPIAVWLLEGDVLPPAEGEPYSIPRKARARRGPAASGGAAEGPPAFDRARFLRERAAACAAEGSCAPMMAAMASLMWFARANEPALADALAPLLDLDPLVSALVLLEPGAPEGLVPSALLDRWGGVDLCEMPQEDWLRLFREGLPNRGEIETAVVKERGTTEGGVLAATTFQDLVGRIGQSYAELAALLPQATRDLCDPARKLWGDQVRWAAWGSCMSAPLSEYFRAFPALVDECCHGWHDGSGERRAPIAHCHMAVGGKSVGFTAHLLFVGSLDFFYVARDYASIRGAAGEGPSAGDLMRGEIYDRFPHALALARSCGAAAPRAGKAEAFARALAALEASRGLGTA